MIINHNMNAMNAHRQMGINTVQSGKAMEKLSSGLRINRAGDDAAGLAISEKMRGQIRGLDQASRNSQDGISMIQTAEGALNETHSILQRMRELAVQASNDTNTKDDRGQLQKEINQLTSEINRIGNTTEFNTQKLLSGNKAGEAKNANLKVGDKFKATDAEVEAGTISFNTGKVQNSNDITVGKKNLAVSKDTADTLKKEIEDKFANCTVTVKGDKNAGYDVTITEKKGHEGTVITEVTAKNSQTDLNVTGSKGIQSGNEIEITEENKDKYVRDGKVNLQVGANEKQSMSIEIGDMRAKALGIAGDAKAVTEKDGAKFADVTEVTDGTSDKATEAALDVTSHANAEKAIKAFDNAINKVSDQRSQLGAFQNRLEHTINNLGTSSENLQAAESRVRDVDMAKEMMNFSKNNILAQAAQAMLAQANQQPQGVLQLLR